MQYRQIGGTTVTVSAPSASAYGRSARRWWGVKDRAVGISLLRRAVRPRRDTSSTLPTPTTAATPKPSCAKPSATSRDRSSSAQVRLRHLHEPGPQGQQERPHDWSPPTCVRRSKGRCGALARTTSTSTSCTTRASTPYRNDDCGRSCRSAGEGLIRPIGVALGPAFDLRQVAEGVEAIREARRAPRRSSTT